VVVVGTLDLEEARTLSKSTDGMEPLKKGDLWNMLFENSENANSYRQPPVGVKVKTSSRSCGSSLFELFLG
jgi:hypothetical protein